MALAPPPGIEEYEVWFKRRRKPGKQFEPLGVKLGLENGPDGMLHLVVQGVGDTGVVAQWNRQSHLHQQVSSGDRILSVNGTRESDSREMVKKLKEDKDLAIRLLRPSGQRPTAAAAPQPQAPVLRAVQGWPLPQPPPGIPGASGDRTSAASATSGGLRRAGAGADLEERRPDGAARHPRAADAGGAPAEPAFTFEVALQLQYSSTMLGIDVCPVNEKGVMAFLVQRVRENQAVAFWNSTAHSKYNIKEGDLIVGVNGRRDLDGMTLELQEKRTTNRFNVLRLPPGEPQPQPMQVSAAMAASQAAPGAGVTPPSAPRFAAAPAPAEPGPAQAPPARWAAAAAGRAPAPAAAAPRPGAGRPAAAAPAAVPATRWSAAARPSPPSAAPPPPALQGLPTPLLARPADRGAAAPAAPGAAAEAPPAEAAPSPPAAAAPGAEPPPPPPGPAGPGATVSAEEVRRQCGLLVEAERAGKEDPGSPATLLTSALSLSDEGLETLLQGALEKRPWLRAPTAEAAEAALRKAPEVHGV